ncbi:MAG TPA: biotin/lipoyl-containing protein [Candidatus Limnocylindria bacterium]|nr:biotin/lipoyl-containing protein [Candidatus Limnocylindria bacterium]
MSDRDEALQLVDGLLEDIRRLALGSAASVIEVETEGISVTVACTPGAAGAIGAVAGAAAAKSPEPTRVHSPGVGIFGSAKEWSAGDEVSTGTVLGSVQSLGAMSEITVPFDGVLRDVLVAGGAPVEYGQPLFAIERR